MKVELAKGVVPFLSRFEEGFGDEKGHPSKSSNIIYEFGCCVC